MMLMSSAAAALAAVTVPENTAQVDAYALWAELLWSAGQIAGLILPAVLLFTGWGARLRTLCGRWTGGSRYRTLTLFAAIYLLLAGLVVLPTRYWRLIVLEGLRLSLIGIAAGLVAAFVVTQIVASFIVGVTPTDPVTFAGITVLFFVIALCACWLPARRAARLDPTVALREQ